MAKTISVTCDGCGKHIENENYQTLTVRRYIGEKHSNVVRNPAFWMCDKCYRKVLTIIPIVPYVSEQEEGEAHER